MGRGDGLLVVGQDVGRCPAQDAEAPVQGRKYARRGPVPQRDHDAEAGERQPGHEQDGLHPADPWTITEVILQPHSRFGDPRPVDTGMAQPPCRFDLRDRAAGGAFRALVAQGKEFLVGLVRADPALDPSIHSSILGRYASVTRPRAAGSAIGRPASRAATWLATVWCEQPVSSAVARNDPVRS